MSNTLESDFKYYIDHQDEMVDQYDGNVIVIKDEVVLGAYDSEFAAVTETKKTHELGTFLVQRVSSGNTDISQTFHSRVAFS